MEINDNADISVGSTSIMIGNAGAGLTEAKRLPPTEYSEVLEYWGTDNLEPKSLLNDIKSNSILNAALQWTVKALYSGGLQYGYVEGEEDQRFIPAKIPAITQVLKASHTPVQLWKGLSGLKYLGNAFPELILTKDRTSIAKVGFNDASFCRWSKNTPRQGSKYCLISAAWEYHAVTIDPVYCLKVPAITRDGFGFEAQWLKEAGGFKYVIPNISLPTLGRSKYASPQWAPIQKTGWLAYANQIPKFKESYLKNASHIKYAVHVPESWWKWKYPKWDEMPIKERSKKRKEEHERFDKFLRGVENAGRSIMMTYRDDPAFQAHGYTKWDIQIIDKKVIEGILTNDVLETTQMIHHAVGVHGTMLGSSPGGKMGAGSGSDQKQAYNIFVGLSQAEQDILLKPYEIMAEYMGYPELRFRFRNRFIADLQDVTPSKREPQDAI